MTHFVHMSFATNAKKCASAKAGPIDEQLAAKPGFCPEAGAKTKWLEHVSNLWSHKNRKTMRKTKDLERPF